MKHPTIQLIIFKITVLHKFCVKIINQFKWIQSQNQHKMTNPHNLSDYKERYFKTKALDHIHGKPTLQQIIKIW